VACRARRARWVAQLGSAARERLAAGETVEAMKLYGLYLQKSPDDAAAHAAYATLMRKQAELPGSGRRQREAALAAINDAVRKNPESLPLRRMLAVSLLELGQFGTAREQLVILRDQAAAATPEALAAADIDLDEITLLEARTCLSTDMISDAAALAARLTGFDADGRVFDPAWKPGRFVTEASVLLATILSEKGEDPRAAERVLAKLTETAPDDHRAWLALARWHAGHGDPRRAADEIARATTLAPDSRDVLAAGFAMALSDGRFDEAARQARRMCELFPELPDGGLCLAEVAVRRGAPQEALEPLQTALERLPDNPAVLLSLANAQLLAGRLDDAGRTIRGLVERATRPNPAVGMLEARLLVARRQWLAAVKKLDAVRPLVAESDEAKRQIDLLLAECHANLG
jgi:Tfp pilus assembly protein PilF